MSTLDLRVYVIPPPLSIKGTLNENDYYSREGQLQDHSGSNQCNINTLAHYLAMNDSLYCCNIFQQFHINPLCRGYPDRISAMKESVHLCELLSNSIKNYLEDACRLFNLNIYKIEIYKSSKPLVLTEEDMILLTEGVGCTQQNLTGERIATEGNEE